MVRRGNLVKSEPEYNNLYSRRFAPGILQRSASMKIKTVWSVYFSATGTTERITECVAKTAAKSLGAEHKSVSFTLPEAREKALAFGGDDLVVFGIPVYAGRIPNLLLPYIQSAQGNGALCVPMVLFGNRNFDDALVELRNTLQDNGFHTISAGAFVGEHSFSRELGAGRPDSSDMELAVKLAEATAQKTEKLDKPPEAPVAVRGNNPPGPYYTPQDRHGNPINILKVKPKTNDSCTGCGLCAAICPLGAIEKRNPREVPGKCMKCCACEKRCPVGAKYFDDAGYLFHKSELEDVYGRRASVELFY